MKSEKRPVAIEDLLRLKRAERPPAEFWARFDRELRAKQLSALVAKRPWWQRLPRVLPSFGRYSLPLGAAAILTVTFVSLRDQPGAPAARPVDATAADRAVAVAQLVTLAPEAQGPARENFAARTVASERVVSQPIATVDVASAAEVVTARDIAASNAGPAAPVLSTSGSEFARGESVTGLRHIGPALTVASTGEVKTATGFLPGSTHGFEARVLPARAAVEPLQQITPPGERTRHKLLTAMMTMSATDLSSRTGERAADRISEERLYDQVSRFGARGAGVSMKF